ncbi:Uncharacterized protein FWK35_00007752 [Aphis craccivora]|uniref:Uncharacterized protein n=1 Tax=Aphis craccivora TaxID=307492 RepID=A0A6G0Y8W4_APHCR|nr:Uncharacterized protein FWK35_00007752 [Aphis craccivora]
MFKKNFAKSLICIIRAKTKKSHSIGESLVLPAAIQIVTAMHGVTYANDLKSIPLSDNTVSRGISNISDDILKQLLYRLQNNYFALQLDESTDISNFSQLLVYVRYIYKAEILEDFLFCQTLKGRTTDGVAALIGSKKGFRDKVNDISPNILFTHCKIHRETLGAKKLEPFVNEVLQNAISLKDEIRIFLLEHKSTLAEDFLNENWLLPFHIFDKLNIFKSMLSKKKKKIRLWINYVNNENFEIFSCFSEFMSDNKIFNTKKIKGIMLVHRKNLENNFNNLLNVCKKFYTFLDPRFQKYSI